jgi:hypothetical protein
MATRRESGPPLPLQMSEADVQRVSVFLDATEEVVNRRLLTEILDCLRAIDDKLSRLLESERARVRPGGP